MHEQEQEPKQGRDQEQPALLARVIVNEPLGLLDYRVPEDLVDLVHKGTAVKVTLRKRATVAYVALVERRPAPIGVVLHDLAGIDDTRPNLPESVIDLVLFAASYYGTTYGEMLAAALPAMARAPLVLYRPTEVGRAKLTLHGLGDLDARIVALADAHAQGITAVAVERALDCGRRRAASRLAELTRQGLLERRGKRAAAKRLLAAFLRTDVSPCEAMRARTAHMALLNRLSIDEPRSAVELATTDRGAYRRLKALEEAGLVRRVQVSEPTAPDLTRPRAAPDVAPTPTPTQAVVIAALRAAVDAGTFHPFLLHGVTGSGKTEVYLQVIEHALAAGRTALVLVPEIALTPQLAALFIARFGERVAIFHSGLTAASRREEWERVARGEAAIGLGARSALFLPLARLGVLVVDEEHETSFKQEESPRYNARDLAVVRARHEGAVVILGSATPSLESHANVGAGRYGLVTLAERILDRPMPLVEFVNLAEAERVGDTMLSVPLARAVERTLSQGEQVILFLNRRGFSPYVSCRDCGHTYRCVDCDVTLTLHRRDESLTCHYCGFARPAPDTCEKCNGDRLSASGLGVEKLASEVTALFGDVSLARLDRDSVKKSSELIRELDRFRSGAAKILIGTQMVAKGHDFPGVTLVGVVLADQSLNFPDFRAAERTFQLLTQVAGRAGRGVRPGTVLVQTYAVEHYAMQRAAVHDFAGFAQAELKNREEFGYPPYTHLAMWRCEAKAREAAAAGAKQVADELRARAHGLGAGVSILGPAPAPLERLRGLWRMQVLVKSPERRALRALVQAPLARSASGVRQILDVDPYSML